MTRRIAYFAEYLALPKSQGTYLQQVSCEHTASKSASIAHRQGLTCT